MGFGELSAISFSKESFCNMEYFDLSVEFKYLIKKFCDVHIINKSNGRQWNHGHFDDTVSWRDPDIHE